MKTVFRGLKIVSDVHDRHCDWGIRHNNLNILPRKYSSCQIEYCAHEKCIIFCRFLTEIGLLRVHYLWRNLQTSKIDVVTAVYVYLLIQRTYRLDNQNHLINYGRPMKFYTEFIFFEKWIFRYTLHSDDARKYVAAGKIQDGHHCARWNTKLL